MFCPNCGTENQEDAKFCEKCGAELGNLENKKMGEDEKKNISTKQDSIIDQKKKEGQTSKSGYILLIVGLLILISNFLVLGRNFILTIIAAVIILLGLATMRKS